MRTSLCIVALLPAFTCAQSIRIDGDGFFRLMKDGRMVFSKSGALNVVGGRLGIGTATFLPTIAFSGNVKTLRVDLDGTIRDGESVIGQLVLGIFENTPQFADGFYISKDRPRLSSPGDGLTGVVRMDGLSAPTVSKPVSGVRALTTESRSVPEPPTGGVTIVLKPVVETASSTVRLSDVAEFKGLGSLIQQAQEVSLGETPPIGVDRIITSARIRTALLGAGIPAKAVRLVMDDSIIVRRRGQIATADDFVAAAITEIESKFGRYGTLRTSQTIAPLRLPLGEMRLVVEQMNETNSGFRVVVAAYVGKQAINRRTFTLERSGVPSMPRLGEQVTVRVAANNVFLETRGRITRVGRAGEPVEVTTADGIRLTGTVVAPGTVEVRA